MRFQTPKLFLLPIGMMLFLSLHAQQGKMPTLRQSLDSFYTIRGLYPSPGQNRSMHTSSTQAFEYPAEDCFTYTYYLKTGDASGQTYINETFTAEEGFAYLAGRTVTAGKQNGLLQQLDHAGNIAWSKSFVHTNRNITFHSVPQDRSGNLLLIGTAELPGGSDKRILIANTDIDGNLQWSKLLSYTGYEGISISPSSIHGIGCKVWGVRYEEGPITTDTLDEFNISTLTISP